MQQRTCNAYFRRRDVRRPLVLVEDDALDLSTLDLSPPGAAAFDIVVCTGPREERDLCPLVTNGTCPATERPDVVVTAMALDNPWRASVIAAWASEGVPVAVVDRDVAWPTHLGHAMRMLVRAKGDDDFDDYC